MTSTGRTRRVGLASGTLFAAAAAAGLVAGCASGSSSSSSSVAPATSASPVTSASAVASSASAAPPVSASAPASSAPGGASTPGASGPPACATRGLQASAGVAQGAAGSIYQVIDFKNISGAPCTLFGYPGVALAGGSPVTQTGAAATRSTANAATLVTLGPGETANALLRITQAGNYPSSSCHPVATTYLQIYPPNQRTPIYLAYKSTGCSSSKVNILTIGVVQTGSGG